MLLIQFFSSNFQAFGDFFKEGHYLKTHRPSDHT